MTCVDPVTESGRARQVGVSFGGLYVRSNAESNQIDSARSIGIFLERPEAGLGHRMDELAHPQSPSADLAPVAHKALSRPLAGQGQTTSTR